MRLIEVTVQKFRNILDSTPIAVEGNVTCLVGKNESGKTATLQALYRLNPVYTDVANHCTIPARTTRHQSIR